MKTFSMTPGNEEEMMPVSCPVCGESDVSPHWECNSFRFSRCVGCGHLYQNPQPRSLDLRARYGTEYFSYELSNTENFFNLMLKGLHDANFFEIENTIGQNRSFLDIGCATGMLLSYLQERQWRVQGVEVCEPAARYGIEKRNVSIFVGTIEEATFPDQAFSFVHFSHVIEHVPEPRFFLEEVNRVLMPDGYVIVVTPNVDGFQARLLKEQWRSAIADHVHLFSRKGLHRLLRETGFTPIRWKTWGGIAQGLAPAAVKLPLDGLAKAFGFGDVMMCLAQKTGQQKTGQQKTGQQKTGQQKTGQQKTERPDA